MESCIVVLLNITMLLLDVGFPRGSTDKESAYSAEDTGDMGSIPGSG